MSMIVVEHLQKELPNVTPLKDVCTEINKGDIISIIGPSGTGKSTFLRCLNQLEHPDLRQNHRGRRGHHVPQV